MVWLHVSLEIVSQTGGPASPGWWPALLADSFARWSLPVFVMVSGALLLDPRKTESLSGFFKKRMHRILIPLVFWSAVYLSLRAVFGSISTGEVLRCVLITGHPWAHLWYLYMIPALYLFTPFLRTYVRSSSHRERNYLTGFIFVLASLHSFLAMYFIDYTPTVLTMFLPFLGYYICGYQLRSVKVSGINLKAVIVLIVGCGTASALATTLLVRHFGLVRQGFFPRTFFSPTVIVMSCAVFLLVMRLCHGGHGTARFVTAAGRIAPATLGIYVLHPLVLAFPEKVLGFDGVGLHPVAAIPLFAISAFLVSYLVIALVMRIPYLRRTVI
ncbi:MAG: acyltransferase family protein [Planctomycetes bacterium]|nr:acyltransferase family protein [Planctomycetota bacterium]